MARDAAIAQLAALSQASQGIPQQGAIPAPADDLMGLPEGEGGDALQELLMQLRTGQMSGGQLLQLVAALVGQGGPQQPQGPPPEPMMAPEGDSGGGQIEQAMLMGGMGQ